MSVRGTTHAIVTKRVINHDQGGTNLVCFWAECDRDATTLYQVRNHEHARNIGCGDPLAKHVMYAFCSERHKQYHLAGTGTAAYDTALRNRGRISGMLPPGYGNSL